MSSLKDGVVAVSAGNSHTVALFRDTQDEEALNLFMGQAIVAPNNPEDTSDL